MEFIKTCWPYLQNIKITSAVFNYLLDRKSTTNKKLFFKKLHPFGHGVLLVKIWFTLPVSAGSESEIIKKLSHDSLFLL